MYLSLIITRRITDPYPMTLSLGYYESLKDTDFKKCMQRRGGINQTHRLTQRKIKL